MPSSQRHAVGAVLCVCITRAATPQCPEQWLAGEGVPGVDGAVLSATVWDPDGPGPAPERLAVGGSFTIAGETLARSVASWDGEAWQAFGPGLEGGSVHALTVHEGALIAGGRFTASGGAPITQAARWTGTHWEPIGSGFSGLGSELGVYSLAVHDGQLIAGGNFTAAGGVACARIARWTGSAWQPLGTGMAETLSNIGHPVVSALLAFQGDLIAGGTFKRAGGVICNGISRWDGASWQPLGTGVSGLGHYLLGVHALTVFQGDVIAGGNFQSAGGVASVNVARWDGVKWHAFAGGSPFGSNNRLVRALAVYDNELIAAGDLTDPPGQAWINIARWDGTSWQPLGGGTSSPVWALSAFGGGLFAGGNFFEAGGVPCSSIARWDGADWQALGSGLNDAVHAITSFAGDLIAGGEFTLAGSHVCNHIARRQAGSWQPLDDGVNSDVRALLAHGNLVVGGYFTSAGAAGAVPAYHVAMWDGSSWSPLGGGLNDVCFALTGYNGDVVAGGAFTTAGSVAAGRIARWDGSAWHALGAGIADPYSSWASVYGLAVHEGGLIAGGSFTMAGGVTAINIARWNGVSWKPLEYGLGMPGGPWSTAVVALAIHEGVLVAGGFFGLPIPPSTFHIAAWNGTTWQGVGAPIAGVSGTVRALAVYRGALVATGSLTGSVGGQAYNQIARWDGRTWLPLGGGLSGTPRSLAVHDQALIVGGWLSLAGGAPSGHLARWGCACYPDCDADGAATPADFGCFQTLFVLADPYADCNSDGSFTVADFGCFQTKFVGGCP